MSNPQSCPLSRSLLWVTLKCNFWALIFDCDPHSKVNFVSNPALQFVSPLSFFSDDKKLSVDIIQFSGVIISISSSDEVLPLLLLHVFSIFFRLADTF